MYLFTLSLPFLALPLLTLSSPLPPTPSISHLLSSSLQHPIDASIAAHLLTHSDPVDAYRALYPEQASEMDERRLLKVHGEEEYWTTEGEKMRLRREGKGFMDLTGREEAVLMLSEPVPRTPSIRHGPLVKKVISHMSTHNMYHILEKGTSFFNRFYASENGRDSSRWLFGEVLDIARKAPSHISVSVEQFPHSFLQSSIIARISPPRTARNISQPITIIGAHQDSINNWFPSLPAPGADDDLSGTTSILEAFRALVEQGFEPKDGPVEFHWYAGEEGGLLGSLDVAEDYYRRGVKIGAMMEYDMTAFVKHGSNATVNIITTQSNKKLTNWVYELAKVYCDVPVKLSELFEHAGSDYMSFTRYGFPATFGTEADPMAGLFDPYVHTSADRMDLISGEFSLEHMLEFSKLTAAFAIEQAGWDMY